MAKLDRVPIRNFSRASGTIFRGGIPDELGLDFIASLGIKTVIDLRGAGGAPRNECVAASEKGLTYFNISLNYLGLPDSVIAPLLAVSLHPRYQPVYLHCNEGQCRTSALVAITRIAVEGWPFEWAYSEMLTHSFKPWQIFLKEGVRRFSERMTPLNLQQRLWALQELVESNIFTA